MAPMRTARKAYVDTRARTWAEVVENAIRIALVVLVVTFNLTFVGVASTSVDVSQARTAVGVTLMAAALLTIIAVTRVWRWRALGSWVVLVMGAAGLCLAAPMTQVSPQLADTWWPSAFIITTCSFLTLAQMRWGWALAGLLLALNVVIRWNTWAPAPALPHLTRWLEVVAATGQMVLLTASAWIVGTMCRRAARSVDAAREENESARASALQQQDDERRTEEVDRFVHDEILHVLRMLAMAGEPVTLPEIRSAVGRMRQRVPGRRATGRRWRVEEVLAAQAEAEAGGFLNSVKDDVPIQVDVRSPLRVALPMQVVDAVRAATREALRNVAQHAQTDRASVAVAVRGMVLTVTIADAGVGFHPQATERRGLASSIEDRMRDVGGAATIASAPGSGTRVQLTWSPAEDPDPSVLGAGLISEMFPYLVLMIAPRLGLGLWFGLLMSGQFPGAGILTVASVVIVAAGAASAWSALRHDRLSVAASAGLTAIAWGVTVLNGLVLPPEAPHPRLLWMPVAAAAYVTLFAIYRPRRESVICGAGLAVASAASTMHTVTSVAEWMPYLAPTMAPLITLALAMAVRIGAERMAWALYQAEHDSALAAAMANSTAAFDRRLTERLSRDLEPLRSLLREAESLADGDDLSPVRSRAEALEESLREALMVGDHVHLRRTMADLRRQGAEVRLRLSSGIPADVLDVCSGALVALSRMPVSQVDLTGLAADDRWRLSVLVHPMPASDVAESLGAQGWLTTPLEDGLLARRTVACGPSPNGATSEAGVQQPQ